MANQERGRGRPPGVNTRMNRVEDAILDMHKMMQQMMRNQKGKETAEDVEQILEVEKDAAAILPAHESNPDADSENSSSSSLPTVSHRRHHAPSRHNSSASTSHSKSVDLGVSNNPKQPHVNNHSESYVMEYRRRSRRESPPPPDHRSFIGSKYHADHHYAKSFDLDCSRRESFTPSRRYEPPSPPPSPVVSLGRKFKSEKGCEFFSHESMYDPDSNHATRDGVSPLKNSHYHHHGKTSPLLVRRTHQPSLPDQQDKLSQARKRRYSEPAWEIPPPPDLERERQRQHSLFLKASPTTCPPPQLNIDLLAQEGEHGRAREENNESDEHREKEVISVGTDATSTKDTGVIVCFSVTPLIDEPTVTSFLSGLNKRVVTISDQGMDPFLTIVEGIFEVKAKTGDTHRGSATELFASYERLGERREEGAVTPFLSDSRSFVSLIGNQESVNTNTEVWTNASLFRLHEGWFAFQYIKVGQQDYEVILFSNSLLGLSSKVLHIMLLGKTTVEDFDLGGGTLVFLSRNTAGGIFQLKATTTNTQILGLPNHGHVQVKDEVHKPLTASTQDIIFGQVKQVSSEYVDPFLSNFEKDFGVRNKTLKCILCELQSIHHLWNQVLATFWCFVLLVSCYLGKIRGRIPLNLGRVMIKYKSFAEYLAGHHATKLEDEFLQAGEIDAEAVPCVWDA